MRHKGGKYQRYNLKRWNKKGGFDILNDMSENVTLVQLMDSLGSFNHAISILGYCIFDSNYEQAIRLTRESLYFICSPYVGEEQVVNFETVFFDDRYM